MNWFFLSKRTISLDQVREKCFLMRSAAFHETIFWRFSCVSLPFRHQITFYNFFSLASSQSSLKTVHSSQFFYYNCAIFWEFLIKFLQIIWKFFRSHRKSFSTYIFLEMINKKKIERRQRKIQKSSCCVGWKKRVDVDPWKKQRSREQASKVKCKVKHKTGEGIVKEIRRKKRYLIHTYRRKE